MALNARIDLRQSQSQTLVMTPQLQQAIKLLQMSNMDLAAYVESELEQNPLLIKEGAREDKAAPEPSDDTPGDGFEAREVQDSADHASSDEWTDAPLDTDYANNWDAEAAEKSPAAEAPPPDYSPLPGAGGGGNWDPDAPGLDQTLADEASLRDHLVEQLNLEFEDPADIIIARRLVDLVDEAGWIVGDLDAVTEALGADPARVADVLARIQTFDPAGVCARNLGECLALQLRDRNRLDPAMECLLEHLDLVARRDTRELMQVCGVDEEDLDDMLAELRALDPKPGLGFDANVSQPVIPDVLMRPRAPRDPAARADVLRQAEADTAAGAWQLELNPDTLPRVLVDKSYYTEVSAVATRDGDKEYISECLATANWLVKSLHQRATTIIKVATEIVRQQQAFFEHGVEFLRPLILRDIAEAVDLHESTISRVTSNKYISTPRGIFELKYFFTTAIAGRDGGDAHSAEAVRHRIRALIDEEPANRILSDDRIVAILQGEGIDIARRTVAKYRESMRIASSVQRRREKAMRV